MEMNNNIVSFPAVPEVALIKPVEPVKSVVGPSKANADKKQSSDTAQGSPQPAYLLKLTIDKDPDSGEYVYKAIDRITGEVVRQLPRKELLDMRASSAYRKGSVITTDI